MGDCLLFADLASKYIKLLKNNYRGYEVKYLGIYYDKWGENETDFHYFLRFKLDGEWYYMDRYKFRLCDSKLKGKKIKEITYDNNVDLAFYLTECGFKNQQEARENIISIVDNHFLQRSKK